MNLSVGIVGLPNVGKSTLFNALLKKQQALAANYPFATIEPNVGIVPVPDERLHTLAEIVASEESPHPGPLPNGEGNKGVLPPIRSATIEFIDIAGLVKGASEGAGLGNKFLSHIREVSVIAHVVRAFEDQDVVREGSVSPDEDYKTIQTELILADLATIENAKFKIQKSKPQLKNQNFLEEVIRKLNDGTPIRAMKFADDEQEFIDGLFLLTAKPEIIVLNVPEAEYNEQTIIERITDYARILSLPEDRFVVICAKIEAELAGLSADDQQTYLAELGVGSSGLERLIQKAYERLGLVSFLTAGEKEVRAWTLPLGSTSVRASGEIHTDFMKKFIKAEVISFEDYIACGGRKKARELGRARLEGKEYIVQDGDVIEFKIGS